MKQNIIFCPVGIPVYNHPTEYDKDNHWRYVKPERLYETFVYQYKDDFEPELGTYDHIAKGSGFKWEIVKKFLDNIDYTKYEYVGFFDDDVITDIDSVNYAISLAHDRNIKMFQLSLLEGSERTHRVVFQDTLLKYSITNFNEGMGCFIHSSLIPILLEFYNFHQPKSGFGLDCIMCHIMKQKAAVIHSKSMYHPPANFYGYTPHYYDVSEAMNEMSHIFKNVYPKFMKQVYNEDTGPFNVPQTVFEIVMK